MELQKRNQKIENLDKNSVKQAYLKFFFFNLKKPYDNLKMKKEWNLQETSWFPFFLGGQRIISIYNLDMNL